MKFRLYVLSVTAILAFVPMYAMQHKGVPKSEVDSLNWAFISSPESDVVRYKSLLLDSEALHYNASTGNVEQINTLIEKYCFPVNILNYEGQTALHKAIKHGQIGAIDALMKLGADPLIPDSKGQTALDKATPAIRDHICKQYPEKCKE
jgi:ankyrin repeat protein